MNSTFHIAPAKPAISRRKARQQAAYRRLLWAWRASLMTLIVVLVSSVIAWWALSAPEQGRPDTGVTAAPAPAEVRSLRPLSAYDQTVTRPLFTQTRRPPPRDEPRADEGDTTLERYQFSGTVLSGETSRAFFWDKTRKMMVSRGIGETLGRWSLEKIGLEMVKLRSGARTRDLSLDP